MSTPKLTDMVEAAALQATECHPAHRKETLVLRRGWLQPPVLRLWVLHLLNASTQQLILKQCRVSQAICKGGVRLFRGASGRWDLQRRGMGKTRLAASGVWRGVEPTPPYLCHCQRWHPWLCGSGWGTSHFPMRGARERHHSVRLCPPQSDRPRPCPGLTLILWKLTLQLAPAREGMKRSPCLLGEDTGELAGVRVLRISETWEGFEI